MLLNAAFLVVAAFMPYATNVAGTYRRIRFSLHIRVVSPLPPSPEIAPAQPFSVLLGCKSCIMLDTMPIGALSLNKKISKGVVPAPSEPIYGGYENSRGEVVLFGADVAYRVNFKKMTIQQRPRLNPEAQARYDTTHAGGPFEYCNASFRRLSAAQILEICSSGSFSVGPRAIN